MTSFFIMIYRITIHIFAYIINNMDKKRKPLRDFAPVGKKECESKCEREVAMTPEGPVVVCNSCMRIVIDNRNR